MQHALAVVAGDDIDAHVLLALQRLDLEQAVRAPVEHSANDGISGTDQRCCEHGSGDPPANELVAAIDPPGQGEKGRLVAERRRF
jgi:hypothetical protein